MHSEKGSITIFSLLSMMLVMATLLSLLELTRYQELKKIASLQTTVALESAFANYSTYLWKHYRLLACKQEQIENILENMEDGRGNNFDLTSHFLLLEGASGQMEECTRLTDGNGKAYVHAVSNYMKDNIVYESFKRLQNQYEVLEHIKNTTNWDITKVDHALEQIRIKEMQNQMDANTPRTFIRRGDNKVVEKNPLEAVKAFQEIGILALLIEDTEKISKAQISLEDTVSHRIHLAENESEDERGWFDKLWLQQYYGTYMSHYISTNPEHGLAYELEYILGGKESDRDNLDYVANELLLIREILNFLYLMSDTQKVEEARLLAIALVGVSANPILIEGVKIGLLTAWAFGESILDVRALLENKKIPLLKTPSLWTLELEHLSEISKGYMIAKEDENGFSYIDYIGFLLLFQEKETLAMRGLDVQECTLRELYNEENLKIDQFIIQARVQIVYDFNPVFSSAWNIFSALKFDNRIKISQEYAYY